MTFQEIRERLANRDAIRERQDIEERAEAERDREQERLKIRQIEKEKKEQQAAERQAEISKQIAEEQVQVSIENHSLVDENVNSPAQQMPAEQGVQTDENFVSSCGQSSKTTTAAADTSSEVARKIKETFMKEVSRVIVKVLDPFRKADATRAKIQTIEDFKHLAKKVGKLDEYDLVTPPP